MYILSRCFWVESPYLPSPVLLHSSHGPQQGLEYRAHSSHGGPGLLVEHPTLPAPISYSPGAQLDGSLCVCVCGHSLRVFLTPRTWVSSLPNIGYSMAVPVCLTGPPPWGFRVRGGRDFRGPLTITKVMAALFEDDCKGLPYACALSPVYLW